MPPYIRRLAEAGNRRVASEDSPLRFVSVLHEVTTESRAARSLTSVIPSGL